VVEAVSFSCSSLGNVCEWALFASNVDEVQRRFRDHARCAHGISPVPADLVERVAGATHPL
jgi:predicted small metal-binding protein